MGAQPRHRLRRERERDKPERHRTAHPGTRERGSRIVSGLRDTHWNRHAGRYRLPLHARRKRRAEQSPLDDPDLREQSPVLKRGRRLRHFPRRALHRPCPRDDHQRRRLRTRGRDRLRHLLGAGDDGAGERDARRSSLPHRGCRPPNRAREQRRRRHRLRPAALRVNRLASCETRRGNRRACAPGCRIACRRRILGALFREPAIGYVGQPDAHLALQNRRERRRLARQQRAGGGCLHRRRRADHRRRRHAHLPGGHVLRSRGKGAGGLLAQRQRNDVRPVRFRARQR